MRKYMLATWISLLALGLAVQSNVSAYGYNGYQNNQNQSYQNQNYYNMNSYRYNGGLNSNYGYNRWRPRYNRFNSYYQGNYYAPPVIKSEIYKTYTNLSNGSTISITTNNLNIVPTLQSSVYNSVVDIFRNHNISVTRTNLYNGVQLTITADNYYNTNTNNNNYYYNNPNYGYQNGYNNNDYSYNIQTIQNFTNNAMPEVSDYGVVLGWN